jgi:hypothetical protein
VTTAPLVASLLLLLATPVCDSDRCPMSATQRAACRSMGLDCCQTQGGAVSHTSPHAQVLVAALAPAGAAVVAERDRGGARASSALPDAAPAVVQGVGLYTLLAVFRI